MTPPIPSEHPGSTSERPRTSPFDALSIVVPAYNESARIQESLRRIADYCRTRVQDFEVIVVDDGSTDGTAEAATAALDGDPCLRVIRHPRNFGKGRATRTGALAARHPYILLSDADLSTPIEELEVLAPHATPKTVVVASRGLPESSLEVRQPLYRETMGRIFNLVVRFLLVPGISDTQCGFKLFGDEVARAVFSALETDRFAFDVEVLARARQGGFEVVEVPVRWRNDARSRVHPVRDSASMLRDVIRIWWRLKARAPRSERSFHRD